MASSHVFSGGWDHGPQQEGATTYQCLNFLSINNQYLVSLFKYSYHVFIYFLFTFVEIFAIKSGEFRKCIIYKHCLTLNCYNLLFV